jgi:hypothetical protein
MFNNTEDEILTYIVASVQQQYPNANDDEFIELCEKMSNEINEATFSALELNKKIG